VRGSTDKLFDALTSTAGYNGWWSKDCQIAEKPGGESKLKFNKDGAIVSMGFRVDEVVPQKAVRWTCVAHDMESWIGTTLNWRLAADGDVTEVSFEHAGWKGDAPWPGSRTTTRKPSLPASWTRAARCFIPPTHAPTWRIVASRSSNAIGFVR